MNHSITIVKLLGLISTTQLIAGLCCCGVSPRENRALPLSHNIAPKRKAHGAPQAVSKMASTNPKKEVVPTELRKIPSAKHEMTLDELTDIRPENIPPGTPCVFINGELRCTWCDVVINKQPPQPQNCPQR